MAKIQARKKQHSGKPGCSATSQTVCRYFEMDEDDLKTCSRGNQHDISPWNVRNLLWRSYHPVAHSMDFEVGQSLSGKPTYWVQICLSTVGSWPLPTTIDPHLLDFEALFWQTGSSRSVLNLPGARVRSKRLHQLPSSSFH